LLGGGGGKTSTDAYRTKGVELKGGGGIVRHRDPTILFLSERPTYRGKKKGSRLARRRVCIKGVLALIRGEERLPRGCEKGKKRGLKACGVRVASTKNRGGTGKRKEASPKGRVLIL